MGKKFNEIVFQSEKTVLDFFAQENKVAEEPNIGGFKVGDIVTAINDNYSRTDENMINGEVIEINEINDTIKIRILLHKYKHYEGESYWVSTKYFKHTKRMKRVEQFVEA